MNKIYKLCKKCGYSKEISEFSDCSTQKDGKKSYCRPCDRAYNKERYERIKPDRQKQIRAWNAKNKEKLKEYKKNYIERQKLLKNTQHDLSN